ncbi:MAG: OmpA family protein [Bacteroidota bacterium]|nr:OmpA family protein [Bacteroidota bacterium]
MRKGYLLAALLLVVSLKAQDHRGRPVRLGPNVNSSAEEIHPIISPDGKTLYFVRGGHAQNIGFRWNPRDQDAWYSKMGNDGEWGPARNMGPPINNRYHNSLAGITGDGTQAIVLNYYREGEPIESGYSWTRLSKKGWSMPIGIDIMGFSEISVGPSVSQCLSEDGKTIVFSASRNRDDTNQNLYVTFHVAGSEWSLPQPLVDLNTDDDEICPFLAADGKTLYFSSDRKGGYGDDDVYMARRLDDSWESWSEPVNLGPSVNTEGADMYYTIPASGRYAYYVSSAETGNLDIYRIELPESMRPLPVVLITGRIYNSKTKKPIETEVVYESLADGTRVGSVKSNPLTGMYQIILPSGKLYGFYANAEGMYPVSQNIDLRGLDSYREIRRDLSLTPIEQGATITLNNIFFDFDKSDLRSESKPEIDRLIALLEASPSMRVQLNGHTDNVGTVEYNRKLSENRANAVREYILTHSTVRSDRVTTKGFGFTRPVSPNDDEEGKQKNRRVEFLILSK